MARQREGEEVQKLQEGDMFCVPSGKLHTIQLLFNFHLRRITRTLLQHTRVNRRASFKCSGAGLESRR